jgi:Major Facilitator Superfamily
MNARAACRLWLMLTALGTVFALSHAFRTVATIMAAPLRTELHASPQDLGLVAGAFHLSFAALQVPVGVALDRYGPRRTVAVAFVAVVLGAIVSALAPTVSALVAGQLVIGAGCAPAWLATMVFIPQRYPAERFARLSGTMLAFGGLGMMLVGNAARMGGRDLVVARGLPRPRGVRRRRVVGRRGARRRSASASPAPRETLGGAFGQIGTILAQPHTLGIIVLAAVSYASLITLRGLRIVPLLADRHGYGLVQSGHVVLAASFATLFGPPLFGFLPLSDRARRLWIIGCTLGYAGLFGLLARGAPDAVVVGVVVVMGVLAGYFVLQYADVRAAYADSGGTGAVRLQHGDVRGRGTDAVDQRGHRRAHHQARTRRAHERLSRRRGAPGGGHACVRAALLATRREIGSAFHGSFDFHLAASRRARRRRSRARRRAVVSNHARGQLGQSSQTWTVRSSRSGIFVATRWLRSSCRTRSRRSHQGPPSSP